MKSVGIIGGLGPETTAEFYLDIILSCQKKCKISRPPIIISSVPLPYKLEEDAILKNEGMEGYLPFLITEAKRLERAGADFIVMPCNTLHIFIENIRDAVKVPVLSIIEETVNFFKGKNPKKIGIISTLSTLQNKLYEKAFQENNIDYETPDAIQQAKIGKIIFNLVNGKQNSKDRENLIGVIDSFKDKSADCALLACTDLQLLITEHQKLKVFDTMKILADATVREILK